MLCTWKDRFIYNFKISLSAVEDILIYHATFSLESLIHHMNGKLSFLTNPGWKPVSKRLSFLNPLMFKVQTTNSFKKKTHNNELNSPEWCFRVTARDVGYLMDFQGAFL